MKIENFSKTGFIKKRWFLLNKGNNWKNLKN